jgi:hypothetical protein
MRVKPAPKEKGDVAKRSCNSSQPGARGHASALRARKWLGKGARPFALTFELAQKQIARWSSQFVCWLSGGDSRQAAGVRFGVVVTHFAHVLAYRASLSHPLQARATLHAMPPHKNKAGRQKTAPPKTEYTPEEFISVGLKVQSQSHSFLT